MNRPEKIRGVPFWRGIAVSGALWAVFDELYDREPTDEELECSAPDWLLRIMRERMPTEGELVRIAQAMAGEVQL